MVERERLELADLPSYIANSSSMFERVVDSLVRPFLIGCIVLSAITGGTGYFIGRYFEKDRAVSYLNREMQKLDERDREVVKRLINDY